MDTYFSNQSWTGVPTSEEAQATIDVAKARECYNSLALSCNSDEVLQQLGTGATNRQIGRASCRERVWIPV